MKRLIYCCDGTWNTSDSAHPTNVVKLAQMVVPTTPDGTKQIVNYVVGVGSGRGAGRLARLIDRFAGGALGTGLMANVVDAYRALVFAYEPGDEIYIFGFSRGAFTARSLAGLIRSTGIIEPRNVWMIPEAVARYRSGEAKTKPDDEASFQYRLRWSPGTYTSMDERIWREGLPAPKGAVDPGQPLSITYLGVWDTVGALGVPGHLKTLASLFNGRHGFHDAKLSRSVKAARHAVAIDERRRTFDPTLWEKLEELDAANGGRGKYYQKWFPGNHGSVGGGGEIVSLSNDALIWVAEGAQHEGLVLNQNALKAAGSAVDYRGSLRNTAAKPGFLAPFLNMISRDRAGPKNHRDLSRSARARWHETPDRLANMEPYRPGTLDKIRIALNEDVAGSRLP